VQINIYEYYWEVGLRCTSYTKKELGEHSIHHKGARREQNPK